METKLSSKTLIFATLLIAFGINTLRAQESITSGDLMYSVNEDGQTLTVIGHVDGQNATGILEIPEIVLHDGVEYEVTVIGERAFQYCDGLTGSLAIPNTIIVIEDFAFFECHGFDGELTIGNHVNKIGVRAFEACVSLNGSLVIPNSVTELGSQAFAACYGFTSLSIPESIDRIPYGVFSSCGFTGPLEIPNTITAIESHAFSWCGGFTGSLIIPESVTDIGYYAFAFNEGFTDSLVLPQSLTGIGDRAFGWCHGFTSIVSMASEAPMLGDDVFYEFGCDSITVPCGCVEYYKNSDWNQWFAQIHDDCDLHLVSENESVAISAFPNPAQDNVTIKAENIAEISVQDMLGNVVLKHNCSDDNATVDTSSLPNGVYFCRVKSTDGKMKTTRIIVQH